MRSAILIAGSFVLVGLSAASARADIPVPDPPTVWSRGQAPNGNTIVAAGAAISAVIVAAGLLVARFPVRTTTGRVIVAGVAGGSLLLVLAASAGAYMQAQRDAR